MIETDSPAEKKIKTEGLTSAEKAFKKHQDKNFIKKIEERTLKTHKNKVEEFNKKLTDLAEHYDIPRVGPG